MKDLSQIWLKLYIETIIKKTVILEIFLAKEKQLKKLILSLAIFMHITSISKKNITLYYTIYIYYSLCFQKKNNNIKTFINSDNKVNIITLI